MKLLLMFHLKNGRVLLLDIDFPRIVLGRSEPHHRNERY